METSIFYWAVKLQLKHLTITTSTGLGLPSIPSQSSTDMDARSQG
jgi:hypothetical protein